VRGHGRSTVPNWTELPKTLTHLHCALDTLALLDHLGIERCKAIGVSMGGNILLHMATMRWERLEAIVIVSATPYFPGQARKVMAALAAPENQPASEWERMRRSHPHGDQQVRALSQCGRSPVGMTSGAVVKEEQRRAFAVKLVVQDDAVPR